MRVKGFLFLIFIFSFYFVGYKLIKEIFKGSIYDQLNFFDGWHYCIKNAFDDLDDPEKFYEEFAERSNQCDQNVNVNKIQLDEFPNSDEIKYAILPINKTLANRNILVTVGVGRDISAEMRIDQVMNLRGHKMNFFGADPIKLVNENLYNLIGKYYPLAIDGKTGNSEQFVLAGLHNYSYARYDSVGIDDFLIDHVQSPTIDNLWLDSEFAEWRMLDLFYRNGLLDKSDIIICQINVEFHSSDDTKKLLKPFIHRVIREKRYGFFKALKGIHMRLYFFNFESKYCVSKFIQRRWMRSAIDE